MTKVEFEMLVEAERSRHHLSYIGAIYAALDDSLKSELDCSGVFLACERGCAVCCHQMVTCTKPEIDEIVLFISRMDKKPRRNLKRQLEASTRDWEQYYHQKEAVLRQSPFLWEDDWMGKPCPFLGADGACIIYPVRIIDCRTMSSLTKCESLWISNPKRFRFECELWANNLILEHQEKIFGYQAVSPLGHWLLLCRNNNWQLTRNDALLRM